MRKFVILSLIAVGLLLVSAVVIGGYFFYISQQPLYEPGDLHTSAVSLIPPPQPDEPGFWQVDNEVRLHYFAQGNGRPVLILHGGPGFPFSEPLPGFAPLANEYEFYYYDQRGSGQSTRPIDRFRSSNYLQNVNTLDESLGIGAQLADIERIRHILGEDKLILVGHSFGAFLAALYAAEFPDHVDALVLIAPANVLLMPQSDEDLFAHVRQNLPASELAGYDAFLADYLNFGDIFSHTDAALAAKNIEFARYYQMVTGEDVPEAEVAGGWMVQGLYLSMGTRHDYREALAKVTAPALVIHGANDLQSEATSAMYSEAFPNGRLHVLATGHNPFTEDPEGFAEVVGAFLETLP